VVVLHLLALDEWRAWRDGPSAAYAPASLAAEGFVHCTGDDATMLAVANAFYRSLPGEVVVVSLDPDRLASEVRWEAPAGGGPPPGAALDVRFPHVYGPLERGAVVSVRMLWRAADGAYVGLGATT
jgi:uncharacterized protein (DUF952 family)